MTGDLNNNLKITLVKSTIGVLPKHKRTVTALGLKKINSSVIKTDSPATRGMIRQVSYLLSVCPIDSPEEN